MKLYVIKYCANEFDDLGYDSPYPIYYSLDQNKTKEYFKSLKEESIKNFNEFMKNHPEYQDSEDYQIIINEDNELEWYVGNWFYKYIYLETELDKDLRWAGA